MIPPDEVTEGWYWARRKHGGAWRCYYVEDIGNGNLRVQVPLSIFCDPLSDFDFHSRIPMPDEAPSDEPVVAKNATVERWAIVYNDAPCEKLFLYEDDAKDELESVRDYFLKKESCDATKEWTVANFDNAWRVARFQLIEMPDTTEAESEGE